MPNAISVTIFSAASSSHENAQVCCIAGIMLDEIGQSSIFHLFSWLSHKAKESLHSTKAFEILAAGGVVDEAKILGYSLSMLNDVKIGLHILIDSKDLFWSLNTHRKSVDRSIRADISAITYKIECENINQLSWAIGKVKMSNLETKQMVQSPRFYS